MFLTIIKRLGDFICICFAVLLAPCILFVVVVGGLMISLNNTPHNNDIDVSS